MAFLIPSSNYNSSIIMVDAAMINLDDTPVTIEKRGRGRPRGSNNKPKIIIAPSSSTAPVKCRHGRPIRKQKTRNCLLQMQMLLFIQI
jgi:hypothetical protein